MSLSQWGDLRLYSSRGAVGLATTDDTRDPAVFVDGVPFPAQELNMSGIAGVPLRFSPNPHRCGSVFIWTRRGG